MKRSSTCGKVGVEGSSTGGSIRSDDQDVIFLRSGRKVTAPKPQQTSIDYPRDIASEVGPAQTMTESLTPLHPTPPPEKSSRPRLKRSSTNFCGKLEPRCQVEAETSLGGRRSSVLPKRLHPKHVRDRKAEPGPSARDDQAAETHGQRHRACQGGRSCSLPTRYSTSSRGPQRVQN